MHVDVSDMAWPSCYHQRLSRFLGFKFWKIFLTFYYFSFILHRWQIGGLGLTLDYPANFNWLYILENLLSGIGINNQEGSPFWENPIFNIFLQKSASYFFLQNLRDYFFSKSTILSNFCFMNVCLRWLHLLFHDTLFFDYSTQNIVLGVVIWMRRSQKAKGKRQKCMKLLKKVDILKKIVSETIFEKIILRIFEEKYLNWIFSKRANFLIFLLPFLKGGFSRMYNQLKLAGQSKVKPYNPNLSSVFNYCF